MKNGKEEKEEKENAQLSGSTTVNTFATTVRKYWLVKKNIYSANFWRKLPHPRFSLLRNERLRIDLCLLQQEHQHPKKQ